MTYKLPIEKKTFRAKIAKHTYCGRYLHSVYNEQTGEVAHYHATKGYRRRKA